MCRHHHHIPGIHHILDNPQSSNHPQHRSRTRSMNCSMTRLCKPSSRTLPDRSRRNKSRRLRNYHCRHNGSLSTKLARWQGLLGVLLTDFSWRNDVCSTWTCCQSYGLTKFTVLNPLLCSFLKNTQELYQKIAWRLNLLPERQIFPSGTMN